MKKEDAPRKGASPWEKLLVKKNNEARQEGFEEILSELERLAYKLPSRESRNLILDFVKDYQKEIIPFSKR